MVASIFRGDAEGGIGHIRENRENPIVIEVYLVLSIEMEGAGGLEK